MNSWSNEYGMMNQFAMPIMPNMMPQMIMTDFNNQMNATANTAQDPLIGPVLPEGFINSDKEGTNVGQSQSATTDYDNNDTKNNRRGNRSHRHDRKEYERDRDRSRSRRRSRSHDRSDRSRRDRNDRSERNQHRQSKWDNNDTITQGLSQDPVSAVSNMMYQGMIPYNNLMAQPTIDMNMHTLPNMMAGMTAMPNMMTNMMEHNMLMMQQQMISINQPIQLSNGILLLPNPGVKVPSWRERPPGCRTIFIGGLQPGVQEDTIREIFQRFGDISDIKIHNQGVYHVRFEKAESVEQAFFISGYRFKSNDQVENEATTIFIDYALNRDDQIENERNKYKRASSPARIEVFNPVTLANIVEKIKTDDQFAEAAPTLVGWLERGECNKKNVNSFYSMIQASNNQIRRLFNEKMQLDEEFQTLKNTMKDKFSHVLVQFEQIAKIMTAAKHQRVSDHFSKQQRRNVEMWLKITEEVDNMKDEYNLYFEDEEIERVGKNMVSLEKYEKLKVENENLVFELEGYKNEAHLAKDEAERKFEKFKAHFIAQQALQNKQQIYLPLPSQTMSNVPPPSSTSNNLYKPQPPLTTNTNKPKPPPPTPDDMSSSHSKLPVSDVKLISMLTVFLMAHPLGATLDYIVSYLRSMLPSVNHVTVHETLRRYPDVFNCNTSGIGTSIEQKWTFATFDGIKKEK
ncbi:ecto-NOX disulfide-thiol exchanger 1-like [Aphomia sociella]